MPFFYTVLKSSSFLLRSSSFVKYTALSTNQFLKIYRMYIILEDNGDCVEVYMFLGLFFAFHNFLFQRNDR